MTDQTDDPPPFARIRRVQLDVSPPSAAHLVTWTRVGSQILLEIGYFDFVAMNQQITNEPNPEKRAVDWFVTNRFLLDIDSAKRFVEVIAQLGKELVRFENAEGADVVQSE